MPSEAVSTACDKTHHVNCLILYGLPDVQKLGNSIEGVNERVGSDVSMLVVEGGEKSTPDCTARRLEVGERGKKEHGKYLHYGVDDMR